MLLNLTNFRCVTSRPIHPSVSPTSNEEHLIHRCVFFCLTPLVYLFIFSSCFAFFVWSMIATLALQPLTGPHGALPVASEIYRHRHFCARGRARWGKGRKVHRIGRVGCSENCGELASSSFAFPFCSSFFFFFFSISAFVFFFLRPLVVSIRCSVGLRFWCGSSQTTCVPNEIKPNSSTSIHD